MRHHHRRRNPGGGQIAGLVKQGVAVVAGAVGTKLATQMVLGANNTGIMGYLGNAVATGLAAWGAHAITKDKSISQGVTLGGVVQIVIRAITDFTPFGQYASLAGLGDYQVTALQLSPWVPNGLRSPMPINPWGAAALPPGTVNSSGAGVSGVPSWD